ncbi:MAG: MATE family efflux transporter [Spirochaetes bacterium]|nr:MATE family efflux transporter [Spirochaetota bacterium]
MINFKMLIKQINAFFSDIFLQTKSIFSKSQMPELNDKTKIPLSQLVLPMLVENIIRTSIMSVDQLMLYAYSEKAVAAVGVINQLAFFIQLIYMMVAIGSSIHISQNLGAGRKSEAGLIGAGSFVLMGIFSFFLSVIMVFSAGNILQLFTLEPEVYNYASTFMIIYCGGSVFLGLNIASAAILRAYGFSKDPMIINGIAFIFTIAGNSLCLFGWFGFPVFGVAGVAVVTVTSQLLALILMMGKINKHSEINIPFRKMLKVPANIYYKILSVGIPTAGENLMYNISQIVITGMIAKLGTSSLAAYSLVITLSRYIFISGVSIGSGTQIKVGYYVGKELLDDAHRKVYKYFAFGFTISAFMVILINLFKAPILSLFTKNSEIISIASSVLLIGMILEPGRNFNTIIIPGLKGSGDVRFPVVIGAISMWAIGVTGAWLFGIHFGMGLFGIWIALTIDEWTRGLIMLARWRSGAWRTKGLIKN